MATIKSFTDIPQSKKLAEILPLESADNVIVSFGSREGNKTLVMPKETLDVFRTPFTDIRNTVPCWSLAALLNIIPGGQVNRMANSDKWEASSWNDSDFEPVYYVEDYDNPVDACYEMILKLHELNLL